MLRSAANFLVTHPVHLTNQALLEYASTRGLDVLKSANSRGCNSSLCERQGRQQRNRQTLEFD